MFEKAIESLKEEIRSLETNEGKAAYEKKKEESDKRAEEAKRNRVNGGGLYDECLQHYKSHLAHLIRQESFATVTGMTDEIMTVKCEDDKERCISIYEFALYSPVIGSRVAVNFAGSKVHLVLYRGELGYTDTAAVLIKIKVDYDFHPGLDKNHDIYKSIPYSYFGTSDIEFNGYLISPIDVFYVDGEYYPAPSCLEKLRDARKTNLFASLQETLEEILDAIQQDSEEYGNNRLEKGSQ